MLGMVLLDLIDNDYSWVIFGRDELQRYRAIDVKPRYRTLTRLATIFFKLWLAQLKQQTSFFIRVTLRASQLISLHQQLQRTGVTQHLGCLLLRNAILLHERSYRQ